MNATDFSDCKQALAAVTEVLGSLRSIIAELENTEKLIELQQDIGGVDDLVRQGRVRLCCVLGSCLSDDCRYSSIETPSHMVTKKTFGYFWSKYYNI